MNYKHKFYFLRTFSTSLQTPAEMFLSWYCNVARNHDHNLGLVAAKCWWT